MHLKYHGGHCCGIFHFYGFCKPSSNMPSRLAPTDEQWDSWVRGVAAHYASAVRSTYARPTETGEDRLKALIYYVEQNCRAQCIIEVVLDPSQVETWRETLEGLHFKEVNSAINSWRHNRIHIFHRNCGADDVPPMTRPKHPSPYTPPTPKPEEGEKK